MADKSCFVVMGYGQRRDPVSGKKVDLDRIYFEIIKPIAEERGYRCYRGDEVHDSGIIDVSMYYGILDADLVIADITTLNPNAVYELGVRHGVRKRKTIIMMEQSNKFFFDLNHVRTITYKYPRFGGIRQAEIEKTKSTLRDVVIYLDEHIEKDSPLYTYVEDLCEPQKKSNHSVNSTGKTLYERVKEAIQFRNQMNYDNAVTCFGALNKEFPSDIFFLQQLALCTYKNQKPTKKDPSKLTEKDLLGSAKGAAALDRLVKKYNLSGMAYYYEGKDGSIQRTVATSLIVGNSILNAQGVPMCGEFDIKTNVAMLIMDRLDIGGSFAELHPFDFSDNTILIGHDGPHHIKIANGKPILRSLTKYHGKPGSGASVEFKLKEGPITMLGITQTAQGKFKFVIGEGYSQAGPIPPTGNTNTRGYFPPSTKDFIKRWCLEGPTHHYALGIGHKAETIKKIADCLGIESVIVR